MVSRDGHEFPTQSFFKAEAVYLVVPCPWRNAVQHDMPFSTRRACVRFAAFSCSFWGVSPCVYPFLADPAGQPRAILQCSYRSTNSLFRLAVKLQARMKALSVAILQLGSRNTQHSSIHGSFEGALEAGARSQGDLQEGVGFGWRSAIRRSSRNLCNQQDRYMNP